MIERLAITMRTANRRPAPNYVGATIARLLAQGVEARTIHLCATDPDVAWLTRELAGAAVTLHVPARRLTPNENGLALVRAVDPATADWILLLEDDLEFCADVLGSMTRWLERHARPDRHLYQFFGFAHPPAPRCEAFDFPLPKHRASQAIVLRMTEALDFLAWGDANLATWRSHTPWGTTSGDGSIGWDKFVAAWALTRWPGTKGVMSHPHFVRHVGLTRGIHGRSIGNDGYFGGRLWRYRPPTAVSA